MLTIIIINRLVRVTAQDHLFICITRCCTKTIVVLLDTVGFLFKALEVWFHPLTPPIINMTPPIINMTSPIINMTPPIYRILSVNILQRLMSSSDY